MSIGYTTGVFDLFHIGHLNILRNARAMCDRLIVGVTTDELMLTYKKRRAIIPYPERCEIVRSVRYVDAVIPQETQDKFAVWQKLKFDIMFVGDDWYQTERWEEMEKQFRAVDVKIVYFPYTKGVSSTLLNNLLLRERDRLQTEEAERE